MAITTLEGGMLPGGIMLGVGALLMGLAQASLTDYRRNKNEGKYQSPNYAYVVISLVLALAMCALSLDNYQQSQDKMYAGLIGLSAFTVVFYLYKLTASTDVGSHAQYDGKRD